MTRRHSAKARDAGNASIILVLITPALFGVASLVVDGGRAINARQRAADQGEQAAQATADARMCMRSVRARLSSSTRSLRATLPSATSRRTATGTVTGTATARPARGIVSEERP